MKILITGAAGFIGFHLVKNLLKEGNEVVGLDNINDYYDIKLKYGRLAECGIMKTAIGERQLVKSTVNVNYHFIKTDLEDQETLENLFEQEVFDFVVHLAAQPGVRYSLENPHAYINSNITGFLNVLEACRRFPVKHLVYASSSSVYGSNTRMPFKTTDPVNHPVSLYAATKKSNELMAHTYSHLFQIPTTGLRFFTVYGPWGRPDMAPMLFADAILNDRPIKVFNHGKMERDFTYVDDIVSGILKVMNRPAVPDPDWNSESPDPSVSYAPYRIYNIGNSKPVKLMDFINELEKNIGKEAIKDFLPMQPGDVERTWADINELKEFGYKSTIGIRKGVYEFLQWYQTFYNK